MPGFLENAGGEVGMSLLMLIMYHMAGWEIIEEMKDAQNMSEL